MILSFFVIAGMIGNSIGMRGDGFVEIPNEVFAKTITILFSTEDADAIILLQGFGGEKMEVLGKRNDCFHIAMNFVY